MLLTFSQTTAVTLAELVPHTVAPQKKWKKDFITIITLIIMTTWWPQETLNKKLTENCVLMEIKNLGNSLKHSISLKCLV